MNFETKHLPAKLDYLAPDSSEIRLLPSMKGGGSCHCTMPPGGTSIAVTHKTVEEIWYFIQGRGQVWGKLGDQEPEVDVHPGVCLTIPVGTHFQFRNTGLEPFISSELNPSERIADIAHFKPGTELLTTERSHIVEMFDDTDASACSINKTSNNHISPTP